jgi:hypothetical protein
VPGPSFAGLRCGGYVHGMDRLNSRVAREILNVESQDLLDGVKAHGGHQRAS